MLLEVEDFWNNLIGLGHFWTKAQEMSFSELQNVVEFG